jgi:hypothetical protein
MDFGRTVTEGTASFSSQAGAPTMLQRILDLHVPPQNAVPVNSPGYEMPIEYGRHKGTIDQWARQT